MLKNINPTTKIPSYITDYYVEMKGIHSLKKDVSYNIFLEVGKVYYVRINGEDNYKAIKIIGGFLADGGFGKGLMMTYVYKTTDNKIQASYSSQFVNVYRNKESYINFAKTGDDTYDIGRSRLGDYRGIPFLVRVFPKTFEMLCCLPGDCTWKDGKIVDYPSKSDFHIYSFNKSKNIVQENRDCEIEGLWIDENGEHLIWEENDSYNFYTNRDDCFNENFQGIDDDFGDDESVSENKTRPIAVQINVTITSTDEETARKAIMEKIAGLIG